MTISGCVSTDPKATIANTKLATLIEGGSAPLILDTRSRYEYDNGHLPEALYFPFWKAFYANQVILERCKTEPVVVYCQHGPRATFAAFALRRSGCNQVLALEGHMSEWTQLGLPVTSETASNHQTIKTNSNKKIDYGH